MKKILYLTLLTTFLFGCKKDLKDLIHDKVSNSNNNNATGFIYTSTNSSSGNAIIALERHRDGSVQEIGKSPYRTGDNGDAAEGDFDTQWALRIVGEYLLAVNAGNNPVNGSISVFKINKANGSLSQVDQDPATAKMDNMDSRGVRAASIAATMMGTKTWVVVGNQFANPNFQGEEGIAFGSIVATPLRNLAVFTFDQSNGLLKFERIGATYTDGANGGPTTVEFNSTGTQIAVSTWGVPHFMVMDPDLAGKQRPGRLYIYNFSAGSLSQTGVYQKTGVSGNIGISWSPNDRYIYMTNFNLHSSVEDHSVTVHDGTTAMQVQNLERVAEMMRLAGRG
jgi:6-phosphogluconolactonase (cycloisomerase 2 family)